jgi:phenylacetate-CoA ligase
MTIIVEIAEKFSKETKPRLLRIRQDVINDLRNVLNLSVDVKLEKPGSLPRSLGKAKRVIDNRKI